MISFMRFLSEYDIHIQNHVAGSIPFTPYAYQERMVDWIIENPASELKILKARQMGVTTNLYLLSLYEAVINDKKVLYCSANNSCSKNVGEKQRNIVRQFPSEIAGRNPITTLKDNRIEFAGGGEILLTNAQRMSSDCRGSYRDLIIFDEAAYMHNLQELLWASYPALAGRVPGKIVLASSTGPSPIFKKKYKQGAKIWDSSLFLPWNLHPKFNHQWAASQIKSMGMELFRKEYCGKFS